MRDPSAPQAVRDFLLIAGLVAIVALVARWRNRMLSTPPLLRESVLPPLPHRTSKRPASRVEDDRKSLTEDEARMLAATLIAAAESLTCGQGPTRGQPLSEEEERILAACEDDITGHHSTGEIHDA